MSNVGQLIHRTRRVRGWTLTALADALEMSIPYMSEIERGKKRASVSTLRAIGRVLRIHTTVLHDAYMKDATEAAEREWQGA